MGKARDAMVSRFVRDMILHTGLDTIPEEDLDMSNVAEFSERAVTGFLEQFRVPGQEAIDHVARGLAIADGVSPVDAHQYEHRARAALESLVDL